MLQTSEEIATSSHSALRTTEQSIVRQGSLTCAEAKEKVVRGEWSDPNRGQIFARETVTLPHFVVSLHNKEYDEVRWKTLMEEGKYYETEVHARFVEILKHQPRSYVLDVGTNIGYYTLLSAALGHDVISFEPNPSNILRLCESLRLNEWSHHNVNIFQRAISDVEGEMTLFVPHNPGQAFLKPLEDGETGDHKAKTRVVTLDKFAEEQGWFDRKDFSITLLKIDVEGKDPQVVLGGSRLLASGLVKNVLSEARRFGREIVFNSFVTLFEAGFMLKEPAVTMKGTTPKEHAQSVVDYYQDKLGKNSMRTDDLWWVKK
jgi:FkbM family methyltransferase